MKRFALYALAFSLGLASCKNNSSSENKDGLLPTNLVNNPISLNPDSSAFENLPTMDFASTLHDFGTIHEGETVEWEFDFKNNGKSPLIISEAKGSCGCTVAEFPKEPIPAGMPSKIKVCFNSTDKHGYNEKQVTISNNTQKGVHYLTIKATILEN
jgi:Protein of unknown function (DUF1573)